MKIQEGYMPFRGYKTYYRIVGEGTPGLAPLLLIHGGPGSSHNYFELMDDYAETGRQLIMYDQVGAVSLLCLKTRASTSKKLGLKN